DEADFSAAAVRASQIYPGVELTRTVVVLDDALIDFYRAKSEMVEITMDWVWHSVGRLTTSLPEATAQGSGPRYQFLEDVRALKPGSQAEISWQVQGGKVSLTLFDMDKAQLFSARGPGFPGEEKLSLVIARKRAQTGQFVAVFQIVADSKRPKPVGLVEQGPNRIVVQLDNARYELTANTARRF
ncbi:hypothetical protein FJY63_06465, partial [Candidatus Sumerlaeota bacterium]|nr:hypothetical protein [Candidatus Sumerlaeota bacterium]